MDVLHSTARVFFLAKPSLNVFSLKDRVELSMDKDILYTKLKLSIRAFL